MFGSVYIIWIIKKKTGLFSFNTKSIHIFSTKWSMCCLGVWWSQHVVGDLLSTDWKSLLLQFQYSLQWPNPSHSINLFNPFTFDPVCQFVTISLSFCFLNYAAYTSPRYMSGPLSVLTHSLLALVGNNILRVVCKYFRLAELSLST